ncbi:Protein of unknown function (DUF2690) [Streptoalloteichus tenebrarius]|uniref:DUF2690 domain-containing protein n=1 Tax=Streptoalloteichus tenebrarius (strain ATCC 17920 / DSM 40477 / JCM 4838 / CBS 697.72 / NBRC 16177 / NCIMB 11028 / NRRL B-12390 / A12253. 1 / ISP 5477) TaxID=1933 RepID=A0ABT1HQ28_STRSD|nr:DUF2690 domain-containing protein [Streptoalloteichus tenebrarius]MCP2257621.1 Protein of unknown function (DUF2690) [Streptoalloteichus tenebrarius]BFE98580.1 hypothetical protein GCM10020241_02560 [Streptoalloteichus tenebrarius]
MDPIAAGCNEDAYTVGSVNTPQGFIELRYSPSCRANWARINNARPGEWVWVCVQNAEGQDREFSVPEGYTTAYTDMVNGAPKVRPSGHGGHTDWY